MLELVTTIAVGRHPDGIAIDRAHGLAYVANFYDGTVAVIDLAHHRLADVVPVAKDNYDVVLAANSEAVYVSSWRGHDVAVLDPSTRRVIRTVNIGFYEGSLVLQSSTVAYAIKPVVWGHVRTVNLASGQPEAIFYRDGDPRSIALDDAHQALYIFDGKHSGSSVAVLDSTSHALKALVPIGQSPVTVPCAIAVDALHPTGSPIAYAVNGRADTVSVIDGGTYQVVATIQVGSRPRGIAIDPARHDVYVANWNDNTVSVIDGRNLRVVATAPVGRGPHGVAVDPVTRLVYITNNWDHTVSVIRALP